jgi:NitT/TauT family transport system substrate-binding protein
MKRHATLLAAVALLGAVVLLAPACASSDARARGSADVLRLGVFPTLTHAPAHVGIGSGIFAEDLAPTRLEVLTFNSGTEAGMALLSGSIDASYMGPWPASSLYLRSGTVAVVSGVAVGGASFVVRRGAGIATPDDLRGKRIAVPNVGNTQDIALRTWLHDHGLEATDEGGDVSITEADSPQLLQLFRTGNVDGAWVPEPYPTYLVDEGVAEVFVDEADLWPPGGFLTANLVVSTIYMDAHPDVVRRLVRANVDAIRFAQSQPLRAQAISARRLAWAGTPTMDVGVIEDAWPALTFTWEPVPAAMVEVAQDAHALGVLQAAPGDVLGIYRLDPLNDVLDDEGLPPVEVPG